MESINNSKMQDVISKIEKLLRLSESDNEHEAMLALARAQELQAKYNISIEDVNSSLKEEQVVEESFDSPDTTSLNGIFRSLCVTMQEHFRVKSYLHTFYDRTEKARKTQLVVAGLPFDVEVFKRTLFFSYNSLRTFSKAYLNTLPAYLDRSMKLRTKNDYIAGFIRGVESALTENEATNALIVVTPNAVIEHINNLKLRSGSQSSVSRRGDAQAYSQGYRDGKDTMGNGNTNRIAE